MFGPLDQLDAPEDTPALSKSTGEGRPTPPRLDSQLDPKEPWSWCIVASAKGVEVGCINVSVEAQRRSVKRRGYRLKRTKTRSWGPQEDSFTASGFSTSSTQMRARLGPHLTASHVTQSATSSTTTLTSGKTTRTRLRSEEPVWSASPQACGFRYRSISRVARANDEARLRRPRRVSARLFCLKLGLPFSSCAPSGESFGPPVKAACSAACSTSTWRAGPMSILLRSLNAREALKLLPGQSQRHTRAL